MVHTTLRAIVHGRVQGVYFRASAEEAAVGLGVVGWIRNRPDGTVETYAVGSRHTLDRFLSWLEHGPPSAEVREVQATWGSTEELPTGFRITR